MELYISCRLNWAKNTDLIPCFFYYSGNPYSPAESHGSYIQRGARIRRPVSRELIKRQTGQSYECNQQGKHHPVNKHDNIPVYTLGW